MREDLKQKVRGFQLNEITEYHVYRRLANYQSDPENRQILEAIADDELRHYTFWEAYSGQTVKPSRWQIVKYVWIARLLGVTFAIKLMERGEAGAQHEYSLIVDDVKEARQLAKEEHEHEERLIARFDEERLKYTGSVVLGINDALVELTGALAGLTLALRDPQLIALTGSITGIAAAMSMGASEYLSTKTEDTDKHPVKAAVITSFAYLCTVILLIAPYLIFQHLYGSLALTLAIAVGIIAAFNYYISVANDLSFRKRFAEMTILSLSIAALSFLIGFLLNHFLLGGQEV